MSESVATGASVCGAGCDTWVPSSARIVSARAENLNTKTYEIELVDSAERAQYRWSPGQFNMIYVPGVGEAAISISSDADQPQLLSHTVRVVGSVTRSMDRMSVGDIIGIRGPYGVGWPVEETLGKDVVLMAGGIGLAPIRPVIYWLLKHRARVRRIVLLYGCRSPEDQLFASELDQWSTQGVDVLVTVDNATGNWAGPVGVVTNLLRRIKVNAGRAIVMVCGPRILNRVAAWSFLQLHVPGSQVYVSLERNMNCGFGRCGHCQYGSKFVCKDGPVFRFSDIADIFAKEEI